MMGGYGFGMIGMMVGFGLLNLLVIGIVVYYAVKLALRNNKLQQKKTYCFNNSQNIN